MLKAVIASLALVIFATSAQAVTFSGLAFGRWINPVGTTGFGLYNFDQGQFGFDQSYAVWGYTGCGGCTTFNNLWAFDGVGSDNDPGWNTSAGQAFKVGDLAYRNGSTYGTDFDGATLSIDLDIAAPTSVSATFDFDISVDNRPNNTGNAVTDGDIARIVSNTSDGYFTYGNTDYTLRLLGFSFDGGQSFIEDFNVPEGATRNVGIYGQIVERPSNVPVPASLPLLAAGMTALAIARRRRHA